MKCCVGICVMQGLFLHLRLRYTYLYLTHQNHTQKQQVCQISDPLAVWLSVHQVRLWRDGYSGL